MFDVNGGCGLSDKDKARKVAAQRPENLCRNEPRKCNVGFDFLSKKCLDLRSFYIGYNAEEKHLTETPFHLLFFFLTKYKVD